MIWNPERPRAGHPRHGRVRIAHLVANYLPVTEHWIDAQIRAADAEALVLNRGQRLNADRFHGLDGIHLSDLDATGCRLEARSWLRHGYSAAFHAAARRFKCDVLHAHYGTEGVLAIALAEALDVPLITSFYGYDAGSLPREKGWDTALNVLFNKGTLFFAEGPALADRLVALGCPADRVRVVPIPVRGQSNRSPEQPALVLICGRLVEKKGTEDGLRALATLRRLSAVPFKAVVVGDGPEHERLLTLARRLGLEEVIQFRGSLGPAEYRDLLSRATLVLQMSKNAADGDCEGGAPVVLSEAAASGVPVVATNHCDIPWIVKDGVTGLLVASGDARAAAGSLKKLIESPVLARRLGDAARTEAHSRFSPATCGDRLTSCYREAVNLHHVAGKSARVAVPSPIVRDIVVDFARRGGDRSSVVAIIDRARGDLAQKGRALYALGQLHARKGDARAAALAFRRWGRDKAAGPYPALEEAKAWVKAGCTREARQALARFLRAHPSSNDALSAAREAIDDNPNRGLLLAGAASLALSSDERRFARALAQTCQALIRRDISRRAQTRLVRVLARLDGQGSRVPAALEQELGSALVQLIERAQDSRWPNLARQAARLIETRLSRWPIEGYRLASLLERGSHTDRQMARRLFVRIARHRTFERELQGGALFHLARLSLLAGGRHHALRYAARSVEACPDHRAAAALVTQLETRHIA